MKVFLERNHYEVLDIDSRATPFEIRRAYKRACQLYGDSLATYSLFTEEERKKILGRIEYAFLTLIDERKRTEYDRQTAGVEISEKSAENNRPARMPIPIFAMDKGAHSADPAERNIAGRGPGPVSSEILSSETLTGKDLARIRTELSVSLEQISERTKVRIWLLQCIEDDRVDQLPSPFHLKKFLEFYAESLGLDGKTVVEKYTKRFANS